MPRPFSITLATLACAVGFAGPLHAADDPAKAPAAGQPPIYGGQMMTPQERDEYRAKMRDAKTPEERSALQAENHKAMQERAKARGVTLPDQPPRGPGTGKGPGYGPGAGGKGPGWQGQTANCAQGQGPGCGPGAGKGPGWEGKGPGYGPGPRTGTPPAPADAPK